MKLFLSSSFADVVDLFVEFMNGECAGKTITFIPTASLHEEVNFYVDVAREALEKAGLLVDELEISTAIRKRIADRLERNDYIYISGGNTFFLLQELERTGADKIIVEQVKRGKVYVGESAGAMVLAPDIEYAKGMDDPAAAPGMDSFTSLGLIDFYPLPHYTNFPFREAVEEILLNFGAKTDLRPFSNTQAIVVNGSVSEILGN